MCCGVVCTTHSVAEEASVNEVVRAGLDDSAFTSDDIVHFDGAAAIAAHPACTGVGIGKPNGNVPDCLILLNNGEDIDGGDDGGDAQNHRKNTRMATSGCVHTFMEPVPDGLETFWCIVEDEATGELVALIQTRVQLQQQQQQQQQQQSGGREIVSSASEQEVTVPSRPGRHWSWQMRCTVQSATYLGAQRIEPFRVLVRKRAPGGRVE